MENIGKKIKSAQAFKLTAAIVSLVVGGLAALFMIIQFVLFVNTAGYLRDTNWNGNNDAQLFVLDLVILISLILLALLILIIVFASLLCNNKRSFGKVITLFVLIAIFSILLLVGTIGMLSTPDLRAEGSIAAFIFYFIWVGVFIWDIVFLIIYLVKVSRITPKDWENWIKNFVEDSNPDVLTAQNTAHQSPSCGNFEQKRDILAKLKNEGIITAAEYKKMIVAEFEKLK